MFTFYLLWWYQGTHPNTGTLSFLAFHWKVQFLLSPWAPCSLGTPSSQAYISIIAFVLSIHQKLLSTVLFTGGSSLCIPLFPLLPLCICWFPRWNFFVSIDLLHPFLQQQGLLLHCYVCRTWKNQQITGSSFACRWEISLSENWSPWLWSKRSCQELWGWYLLIKFAYIYIQLTTITFLFLEQFATSKSIATVLPFWENSISMQVSNLSVSFLLRATTLYFQMPSPGSNLACCTQSYLAIVWPSSRPLRGGHKESSYPRRYIATSYSFLTTKKSPAMTTWTYLKETWIDGSNGSKATEEGEAIKEGRRRYNTAWVVMEK